MTHLHWQFVLAAYLCFAVLIVADVLWPWLSMRTLKTQIQQRLRRELAAAQQAKDSANDAAHNLTNVDPGLRRDIEKG